MVKLQAQTDKCIQSFHQERTQKITFKKQKLLVVFGP